MNNVIRRMKVWALVAAASALLLTGCSSDPTVAEVNGEKILKSEFVTNFNTYKSQVESQAGPDVWKEQTPDGRTRLQEAQDQILDMLVDTRLVAAKSASLGVTVEDSAVEKEIESARAYFQTEDKFNEFLKTQELTLEDLKEMLRKEMLFNAYYDKINENTVINDQEIEAYYNANMDQYREVQASHILLATEDEAEAVKARLDAGENFEALAKELSKDPSAETNGGSLGSFSPGAMVPAFDAAVFAMEKGQISDPVQTDYGFHIIRCEGKQQKTLEEASESIRTDLMSQRQAEVYKQAMDEMRAAAKIVKYPERL